VSGSQAGVDLTLGIEVAEQQGDGHNVTDWALSLFQLCSCPHSRSSDLLSVRITEVYFAIIIAPVSDSKHWARTDRE